MREACTRSRAAQQREGLMSSVKERTHDPGSLAFKRDTYTGFCRMNRSFLDSWVGVGSTGEHIPGKGHGIYKDVDA